MLKWLFRIALILIILLLISKYSTILDNTKIKPYLVRVDTFITQKTDNVRSIFTKSESKTEKIQQIETGTIQMNYGLTGSSRFGEDDIVDHSADNKNNQNVDDYVEIDSSANDKTSTLTGIKKIANLQIKNCVSPRGKFIPKNNYIIAYESRNSADCKWEKRVCTNGNLEGTFQYDTCYYTSSISKQQNSSLLKKDEIEAIQKEYGLVEIVDTIEKKPDQYNGKTAGPGVIISSTSTTDNIPSFLTNGVNGETIKTSINDPDKHFLGNPEKEIKLGENNQTEINNVTLKTRSLKKQVIGYQGEEFISNTYSLTAKNRYSRKICITPWGSIISNGQFVTAWKSSVAENGTCELETRFCIDGKLQGSFRSEQCKGDYPQIINNAPGFDVSNTAEIVGYSETINSMKNNLIALDPMPIPVALSSNASYEIYHQPDEVDATGSPTFQFVPINNNGTYTDSQIILDPGYVIYHQPDE